MKKINIAINQAKLLSYNVELDDEKPEVSATIGLYSGEKKISSFSLRTESGYLNSVKFDLPINMIGTIKQIADELEVILTRECSKSMGELPQTVETE